MTEAARARRRWDDGARTAAWAALQRRDGGGGGTAASSAFLGGGFPPPPPHSTPRLLAPSFSLARWWPLQALTARRTYSVQCPPLGNTRKAKHSILHCLYLHDCVITLRFAFAWTGTSMSAGAAVRALQPVWTRPTRGPGRGSHVAPRAALPGKEARTHAGWAEGAVHRCPGARAPGPLHSLALGTPLPGVRTRAALLRRRRSDR